MVPEPNLGNTNETFYMLGLIHRILGMTQSATIDAGSIASHATYTTTITVTGAQVGNTVHTARPLSLQVGLFMFAHVSALNTVTLAIYNSTAGALTPPSATWNIRVMG